MKNINQIVLVVVLFFALTPQVSAQSMLENGKIPKDLVIKLGFSSTVQFSAEYDFKITADGKVYLENRSHNLPASPSLIALLNSKNEFKIPKLKNRLTKIQLRKIIREFEKSGFFEMNEYYQGDLTLKESRCVTHAAIKELSITANGITKRVAFFLGCGYGEDSPLQSFLNLYNKVDSGLKGIKTEKLENSNYK